MLAENRSTPTQKHIARLANVSQATVSLVLSGTSEGSIPAATRQAVFAAAKKLGYIPNRAARVLRTQQTRTIACIVPDITNPFYPALERGAQNHAEAHGYDLLIYNTDGLLAKERKCLRLLLEGRVDGIVGVFFHLTARDFLPLFQRKIAVVRIEARAKATGPWPLDNLFVDNVAAARTLTNYLLDRGHRKVAMIAGGAGPRGARVQGYREALKARKVSALVVSGRDFSEEQGYQSTLRLIRQGKPPTAIFAGNDIMALGTLLAARDAGLRVPQELAIAGFDDIPMARLASPPLTTITQFQQKLGGRAVEMLLERLQSDRQAPGRCTESPFQLLPRESA